MSMLPAVQKSFSEKEIETIKSVIAPDLNNHELDLYIATAKRTGLDPFSRQIYSSLRIYKDKNGKEQRRLTIATTVDGFRVVAERSGKYRGQVGPYWCGPNGEWVDVWIHNKPPVAAKVGVKRSDFDEPLWAVARYEAYAQDTPTWRKMPELMISKVAECLAFRKAFPNDLSGVYSAEEIKTFDTEKETEKPVREIKNFAPQGLPVIEKEEKIEMPAPVLDISDELPDFSEGPNDRIKKDISDYVITFGQFKNKTLRDIGIFRAAKYAKYLADQEQLTQKPLSDGAREFINKVDQWGTLLNENNSGN